MRGAARRSTRLRRRLRLWAPLRTLVGCWCSSAVVGVARRSLRDGLRPVLTDSLLTPRAGCAVRRSRVGSVNPAQTGLARAGVWPGLPWLRLCPHSTIWCTASTRGDHVRSRALGGGVGKVRHRTLSDLTPRPTAAVRPENDHPARESVDKNEHSRRRRLAGGQARPECRPRGRAKARLGRRRGAARARRRRAATVAVREEARPGSARRAARRRRPCERRRGWR